MIIFENARIFSSKHPWLKKPLQKTKNCNAVNYYMLYVVIANMQVY